MYYEIDSEVKENIDNTFPSSTSLHLEINGRYYLSTDLINKAKGVHGNLLDLFAQSYNYNTIDLYLQSLPNIDLESIELATLDGFSAYREIIERINNAGGLITDPSKLDKGIKAYISYKGNINDMIVPITCIRNMLKDGFFEYAIRSIAHYSDPEADNISAEIRAENIASIRAVAKKHGRTDAQLDTAELSAKGSLY